MGVRCRGRRGWVFRGAVGSRGEELGAQTGCADVAWTSGNPWESLRELHGGLW